LWRGSGVAPAVWRVDLDSGTAVAAQEAINSSIMDALGAPECGQIAVAPFLGDRNSR